MILSLVRVLRFGRLMHPSQAQEWLFPAESASGHLAETKEDRDICQNGAMTFVSHFGQLLRLPAFPNSTPSSS